MKHLLPIFLLTILACKSPSQGTNTELFGYGIDTAYDIPEGLKTGQLAPEIRYSVFDSVTKNTLNYSSKDMVQEKPLVVLFYRGNWCPICNRYLSRLNDSMELILNRANVWIVTPEKAEYVAQTRANTGLEAVIISDTTFMIMNDYGVQFRVSEKYQKKIELSLNEDLSQTNGDEVLPIPATYILDSEHKVYWKHFDPNYRKRASVQEILDNIPK